MQAEGDTKIRFGIEKVELKMTFAKFQVPRVISLVIIPKDRINSWPSEVKLFTLQFSAQQSFSMVLSQRQLLTVLDLGQQYVINNVIAVIMPSSLLTGCSCCHVIAVIDLS